METDDEMTWMLLTDDNNNLEHHYYYYFISIRRIFRMLNLKHKYNHTHTLFSIAISIRIHSTYKNNWHYQIMCGLLLLHKNTFELSYTPIRLWKGPFSSVQIQYRGAGIFESIFLFFFLIPILCWYLIYSATRTHTNTFVIECELPKARDLWLLTEECEH